MSNNCNNGSSNLILPNSSISHCQSRVFNRYENIIPIDSLSTLKQMNNILLNQQSNINNKYVCI